MFPGVDHVTRDLQQEVFVRVYLNEHPTQYNFAASTFDFQTGDLRRQIEQKRGEVPTASFHGLQLKGNEDALKILLYWLAKRSMPSDDFYEHENLDQLCEILIHCWLIGDTYKMRDFQDEAMLELLKALELHSPTLSIIQHVLEYTKSGSRLRMLVIQELVHQTMQDDFDIKEFASFDEFPGLLSEFVQIQRQDPEGCRDGMERMKTGLWKKYLFGSGPFQHWVWDMGGEE